MNRTTKPGDRIPRLQNIPWDAPSPSFYVFRRDWFFDN
jgi:hypothetical protein